MSYAILSYVILISLLRYRGVGSEKSTLSFFCNKSTSILGNGTVFLLLPM